MDYRTRWPAARLLVAAVALLFIVSAVAIASLAIALSTLSDARHTLLDRIAPARDAVLGIDTAVINQETGVRGYLLSANRAFLEPYEAGLADEWNAVEDTRRLVVPMRPDLDDEIDALTLLSERWRSEYARPLIASVDSSGSPEAQPAESLLGKELFDQLRTAINSLVGQLDGDAAAARTDLDDVARDVVWLLVGLGALLVVIISGIAVVLYRILIAPLSGLAADVRQVSTGDFAHEVRAGGPREVVMLGQDVETMRSRILSDVKDLQRSNSELEQFAYVASHDLQEPLRKVASFCQLLERRYSGQLDDRGEQYLRFAVDGAKRMQVLINDLLAFSRVGRITREQTLVDCDVLVEQVVDSYSEVIERTGATVEAGELPTVLGEESLLGGVFGNLVSNALKFRGEEPPHVSITAERTGDLWTFTVKDNGIGIDTEYAERIFVIFQRLHHKDDYPGTGIGLAMCRKIIEYHGGTIWLDTTEDTGTTFRFTLPAVEDDEQ